MVMQNEIMLVVLDDFKKPYTQAIEYLTENADKLFIEISHEDMRYHTFRFDDESAIQFDDESMQYYNFRILL